MNQDTLTPGESCRAIQCCSRATVVSEGRSGSTTVPSVELILRPFRAIGKSSSVGKAIPVQCEHRQCQDCAILCSYRETLEANMQMPNMFVP